MTDSPDFARLRAERNQQHDQLREKLADELGMPLRMLRSDFDPNTCYCGCPSKPCEHDWTGKPFESDDKSMWSTTCKRCGLLSISHDLRVSE